MCRKVAAMPPTDPDHFVRNAGRRIAELRSAQGWTQEDFAEAAEVSLSYVRQVEAGTENLTLRSLVKLANVLHVKPLDLLQPAKLRNARVGRPPASPRKKATRPRGK
jgi:transcriptional regulator with XRE-family HTH domain